LRDAVERFLVQERREMASEMGHLRAGLPYRHV
jgi:predicted N-acyltransferase